MKKPDRLMPIVTACSLLFLVAVILFVVVGVKRAEPETPKGLVTISDVDEDGRVTAVEVTMPDTSDDEVIMAALEAAKSTGTSTSVVSTYIDSRATAAFSQSIVNTTDGVVRQTVTMDAAQEDVDSTIDPYGLFEQFFTDKPSSYMTPEEVWDMAGLSQVSGDYNHALSTTSSIDLSKQSISESVRLDVTRIGTFQMGDPGTITGYEKAWVVEADPSNGKTPLDAFAMETISFEAATEKEIDDFTIEILSARGFDNYRYLDATPSEDAIWEQFGLASRSEDSPSVLTIKELCLYGLLQKACMEDGRYTVEINFLFSNQRLSASTD